MQIEDNIEMSPGPLRHEPADCLDGGIEAFIGVIAVMVMGLAIFSLIAGFDAIFVHKGYGQYSYIIPEPAAEVRLGQDGFQQTLKGIRSDHLTSMMPGRKQKAMLRITFNLAYMKALDAPTFASTAQFMDRQMRIIRMFLQEFAQVRLLIRN